MGVANPIKLPPILMDTGATYEGEWKDGVREGTGIQIWTDGSRYTGTWKNDKSCGKGVLEHADGDVYEGEWEEDKGRNFRIFLKLTATGFINT